VIALEKTAEHTRHYLFEPNSFVPLAQIVSANDSEQEHTAYYHVDHLGTPQTLSDENGDVAWSAEYKAWGEAQVVISEAAKTAGINNPLRFQGQYFDEESGLHYNRHRYYDPEIGRFISSDPIGLMGGFNTHAYAPNPTGWIDPLGLASCPCDCLKKGNQEGKGEFRGGSKGGISRPGIEGHHMPADAVTKNQSDYVGYRSGPAIQMTPEDHAETSSYKNSTAAQQYREKVSTMSNRDAMATEIRDVRRVARAAGDPKKYNTAMQEMLSYSKCIGKI
jgi:RHS repeat-associated protein